MELRKQHGLTQEELAEKCAVNIRSIQRIEAGDVNPRAYTRRILAAALGIEDDTLNPPNCLNLTWSILVKKYRKFCYATQHLNKIMGENEDDKNNKVATV